jgi:hypothetical protein
MDLYTFYKNSNPTKTGYYFEDILKWNDEKLEKTHDYIQYLFPLPDVSKYNKDAPVLTDNDIILFKYDDQIKKNIIRAFIRICKFFGIVVKSYKPFGMEWNGKDIWITKNNHNFLRITRILKFLIIMGMEDLAFLLFLNLCEIYKQKQDIITEKTWEFWKNTIKTSEFFKKLINPTFDIKKSLENWGANSMKINQQSLLYNFLQSLWKQHGFNNNRDMHVELTKNRNATEIFNNIKIWKINSDYIQDINNWMLSKTTLSLILPIPSYYDNTKNTINLSIPPHITFSDIRSGGAIPSDSQMREILKNI